MPCDTNGVEQANMKVALMQPSFLPWQGYFALMAQVDCFMFLDDFQFSYQSYHQRNRLFVAKRQVDWYTVPVKKTESFGKALNLTQINEMQPWRVKMCKRLQANYARTPYFREVMAIIEGWAEKKYKNLAEQNIELICQIARYLDIKTKYVCSSSYPSDKMKSSRVLELLASQHATEYYAANGSFGYMKEEGLFPVSECKVYFQNYIPSRYEQQASPDEFVPYLSILDALFNIGSGQTLELLAEGTKKWLSWEDMLKRQEESGSYAT